MHRTLIVLASFAAASSHSSTYATTENHASHRSSTAFQRRHTDKVTFVPASFSFFSTHRSHRIKKTASRHCLLPNGVRPRSSRTPLHAGNSHSHSSHSHPDPYSQYTHQIAIPLSASSELTSALRSIQTSLVRDCPRLIRACVMPASLRLPLLYVRVGDGDGDGSLGGKRPGKADDVDAVIERVVRDAVRSVGYGENGGPILLPFRGLELQGEDNSVLYAVGYDVNDDGESEKKKEKKKMMMMMMTNEFIEDDEDDGVYIVDDWSSSKTTGPSGYERLERLVTTIQRELEENHGFKTCWPSDEPQGNEFFADDDRDNDDAGFPAAALKNKQKKWRPRVPFVRLPPDFYKDLENDTAQTRTHDDTDTNSEDGDPMSQIDAFFSRGFDGISPTFWYEPWAEEDILPAPGVRMPSVAVYRRIMSGGGESESNFYALPPTPSSRGLSKGPVVNNAGEREEEGRNRMDLPLGDGKLMAREARERAKEMERMDEMERREELEWEEGKARWLKEGSRDSRPVESNDFYYLEDEDYSEFDVSIETGDVTVEGDAAYSTPWSERGVNARSVFEATASAVTEAENTKVGSDPSTENSPISSQQSIPPEKKLPNIEDNPIFQRFWKGESQLNAQGESTAQTSDGTPPSTNESLPPYPSDEHFVGVWRVVSSPLGVETFPADDSSSTSTSPQTSDNLILRVDGQVMGGPILDAAHRQKAAGGSWKMFRAVRKSGDGGEGRRESRAAQTRLRVRLLVPPEKERVLVMEGEVTRLGFGGKDASFSSAFVGGGGLLDGMSSEKILKDDTSSARKDTGDETLMYCGGEAWMEDVDGGRRRKLGPFSLMKLKTVDRSKLIYTVPASRLGQRTPDSDDE